MGNKDEVYKIFKIPEEIIKNFEDLSRSLSAIFDSKNSKICTKCDDFLYDILQKYKYKNPHIFSYKNIDGKRKRIYLENVGCCYLCKEKIGYFIENKEKIKILKKCFGFHKVFGFFDINNMSCGLPREFRSNTCLSFCCRKFNREMTSGESNLIRKITSEIRYLQSICKIPY